MLQKDAGKFPNYISQSNLSTAFLDRSSIKLIVDISLYADQIESEEFINNKTKTIEMKAGLVSGADEVIRNINRKIY